MNAQTAKPGRVTLVGAGPGDPELLTLKAVRAIQAASVILVDDLVGEGVLAHAHPDARITYVGKRGGCKSTPQAVIEQLMLDAACAGENVVRLKGGDPFIFGRGGEEIELLAEAGIPFQVVPGITAASGCAAYAGIPLTHRDHAQACVFITAHTKDGQLDLDWNTLMQPRQTVAVYMGLANLSDLTRAFIDKGAAPSLPIALIDNGTRPNQRVLTGTLDTIAEKALAAGVKGPAILIIGSVVRLREKLDWYVAEEQVREAMSAAVHAAE